MTASLDGYDRMTLAIGLAIILLANIAGFWGPLMELIDHMREENFVRADLDVSYLVTDAVADIVPMLQQAVADKPAETIDQPADAEEIRRL